MGNQLRKQLAQFETHPNVAGIRGKGLMIGIEFVKDRATMERCPPSARFAARFQGAGLRHGVFFYAAGSGPVQDAVLIGPPFTINGEDIDVMVDAFGAALAETLAL